MDQMALFLTALERWVTFGFFPALVVLTLIRLRSGPRLPQVLQVAGALLLAVYMGVQTFAPAAFCRPMAPESGLPGGFHIPRWWMLTKSVCLTTGFLLFFVGCLAEVCRRKPATGTDSRPALASKPFVITLAAMCLVLAVIGAVSAFPARQSMEPPAPPPLREGEYATYWRCLAEECVVTLVINGRPIGSITGGGYDEAMRSPVSLHKGRNLVIVMAHERAGEFPGTDPYRHKRPGSKSGPELKLKLEIDGPDGKRHVVLDYQPEGELPGRYETVVEVKEFDAPEGR